MYGRNAVSEIGKVKQVWRLYICVIALVIVTASSICVLYSSASSHIKPLGLSPKCIRFLATFILIMTPLPAHPAVGLQHQRDRSFDSSLSSSTSSSSSSSSSTHRSTRSRPPRPLPLIPHPLSCQACRACITSTNVLLPPSAVPHSRGFKGFAGKAWLFTDVNNVSFSRPAAHLMSTGVHTMQEITCASCSAYLGWKIVRAHNRSERWKEGYHLLELEYLYAGKQETQLLSATLAHDAMRNSDSEDSS